MASLQPRNAVFEATDPFVCSILTRATGMGGRAALRRFATDADEFEDDARCVPCCVYWTELLEREEGACLPGTCHPHTDGGPSPSHGDPRSYDEEEDAGSLVDFIDDGEAEYDSASDGLSSLSARCVRPQLLHALCPARTLLLIYYVAHPNLNTFLLCSRSEGTGDDEDEERQRQRRRARRADRDHNALLHRRVLNEGLAEESPSMPLLRGQSDLNARLPFIHTVRARALLCVQECMSTQAYAVGCVLAPCPPLSTRSDDLPMLTHTQPSRSCTWRSRGPRRRRLMLSAAAGGTSGVRSCC